jgi:hypothetical protein
VTSASQCSTPKHRIHMHVLAAANAHAIAASRARSCLRVVVDDLVDCGSARASIRVAGTLALVKRHVVRQAPGGGMTQATHSVAAHEVSDVAFSPDGKSVAIKSRGWPAHHGQYASTPSRREHVG